MQTRVLIKRFDATERSRHRWDLDGGLRLDPKSHTIKIPAIKGKYSLSADLYAETASTNPQSVKQWIAFQAIIRHRRSPDGGASPVTSASFKLSDGSDWYFWNGATWIVSDLWNTEEEVSAGIASFPVTTKTIAVRVKLATTDARVTPELVRIKLAYSGVFEPVDDVILRSILRRMSSLDLVGRYEVTAPAGGSSSFVLRLKNNYEISGIDSIFDRTDDPGELVDLADAWNAGTSTATTSSSIPEGHIVRINFLHRPEAALHTSVDYVERKRTPSIGISSAQQVDRGFDGGDDVINRATQSGVKLLQVRVFDLVLSLELTTSKLVDLTRLADKINEAFGVHATVHAPGIDETFSLDIHDPFVVRVSSGVKDMHMGTMGITVRNVRSSHTPHRLVKGVDSFVATTAISQPTDVHSVIITKQ